MMNQTEASTIGGTQRDFLLRLLTGSGRIVYVDDRRINKNNLPASLLFGLMNACQ